MGAKLVCICTITFGGKALFSHVILQVNKSIGGKTTQNFSFGVHCPMPAGVRCLIQIILCCRIPERLISQFCLVKTKFPTVILIAMRQLQ